jgi:hypothetical protein
MSVELRHALQALKQSQLLLERLSHQNSISTAASASYAASIEPIQETPSDDEPEPSPVSSVYSPDLHEPAHSMEATPTGNIAESSSAIVPEELVQAPKPNIPADVPSQADAVSSAVYNKGYTRDDELYRFYVSSQQSTVISY